MTRETRLGRERLGWLAAVACSAGGAWQARPALAADPCEGFAWNVAHERALFATAPVAVTAATAAGPAPTLEVDKLYEITLTPQEQGELCVGAGEESAGRWGIRRHGHPAHPGAGKVSRVDE